MLPLKYAGKNKNEAIDLSLSVLDRVGLKDRMNHLQLNYLVVNNKELQLLELL